MKGYYFITDTGLSRAGNVKDVRRALTAGVGIVQYRAKETGTRTMLTEARELKSLCQGAIFLINDRVDVALAVDADGVHLGQEDMPYETARRLLGPDKIIGITVSTLAEARTAARQGADYLGVSPIFFTRTKPDAGTPSRPHPPAGNQERRIPALSGHRRHHPRERRPGHRGRGRHDLRHFPGGHAPRCLRRGGEVPEAVCW